MAFKKWTHSAAQLKPDTKYNSLLISKFVNCIMLDGKKSVATRVMYDAFDIIAKRVQDDPPDIVFEKAIGNCKPNVEVRSKRVGGSNYQVPMPVNRKRQQTLAFRWIRDACRGKKGKLTTSHPKQDSNSFANSTDRSRHLRIPISMMSFKMWNPQKIIPVKAHGRLVSLG